MLVKSTRKFLELKRQIGSRFINFVKTMFREVYAKYLLFELVYFKIRGTLMLYRISFISMMLIRLLELGLKF